MYADIDHAYPCRPLKRLSIKALIVLAIITSFGCARNQPFRTEFKSPPPKCESSPSVVEPNLAACAVNRHIRAEEYDLLFIEFDDQGLLFPEPRRVARKDETDWNGIPCETNNLAALDSRCYEYPQIEQLIKGLSEIATAAEGRGLSVVLFAHGWKHNADHRDRNLGDFRRQLQIASSVEIASGQNRRVVGIFMAWRGQSLDIPWLENLSFWGRKYAAHRVAEGSSRALLGRLHAFWNSRNQGAFSRDQLQKGARPKDRFLLIGHSFGGLVLFHALSTNFTVDLSVNQAKTNRQEDQRRFFDMVILLNPAIEAIRYTPLHRIVEQGSWNRYSAPTLVLITAQSDWATRIAFQFGRFINTLLESEVSDEERDANKKTPGHVRPYLTHFMSSSPQDDGACRDWKDPFSDGATQAQQIEQMRRNLDIERDNDAEFFKQWSTSERRTSEVRAADATDLQPKWIRHFCGGARLAHNIEYGSSPHAPVWNIQVTDPAIINGHNDISQSILTNMLRQLYVDSVKYPYFAE